MKKLFHKQQLLLRLSLFTTAFLFSLFLNAQTYNHYRGNLHAHSAYSDGNKDSTASGVNTPAGCFNYAKGSKAFDYLGVSEHNHYYKEENPGMHLEDFAKGLQQADDENDDGNFVCMYGMEYGTVAAGHVLIYGYDELIGWEDDNHDVFNKKPDYKTLWQLIADKSGAFATLCHPKNADFQKLLTTPYNSIADDAICGVAIKNGPHSSKLKNYSANPPGTFYSYYKAMLAKGYHLGPTIDHDTHNTVFGRSHQSRTVVLSEELNREDIMDAFREMRFYASEDSNATVEFTINGFPMGSIISDPVTTIEIDVVVTDKTTDKVQTIKVLTGKPGSNIKATFLSGASSITSELHVTKTVPLNKAAYYYVEVIQKDGQKIYTSPIWINE
ncbi:MAG: CehA/McbA family metallohydrolase [Chitinophagaceae bacterium]|nr:CehA/McbA family metallohydrolase [Chitinophagaceae bacterium]